MVCEKKLNLKRQRYPSIGDLTLMLGETMGLLAITDDVRWYGHVLRGGGGCSCLEKSIRL